MDDIYAKFTELYAIHDWYFCENKNDKQEMMREIINDIVTQIDGLPEEMIVTKSAELSYIRGKALNALDDNDMGAEDYLARAIKLDPSNVHAWMAMGQYAWKKGDVLQAKHLFEESLKHSETKEAYQDLSMITRQIPPRSRRTEEEDSGSAPKDRGEIMQESIKLAKKAIALDINDHKSWYILGNAMCMNFFTVTNDIFDLNKALAAYKKSESLGGDCNPDLFYNRGNVHRYLQNYSLAIECYKQTFDIDPSSFSQTNDSLQDVTHFVNRVNDITHHKGYIKKKKFNVIVGNLQNSPFKESATCFKDLVNGSNPHTIISVKVLMIVTKANIPPECFVCVDSSGECAVVSVFHLSSDAPPLTPNQVVTIMNPVVNNQALDISEGKDELEADTTTAATSAATSSTPSPAILIQVHQIDTLKVDGRLIDSKIMASPQLKVDLFSS
jgi:tetratricopeptide (TPR) repeat protein